MDVLVAFAFSDDFEFLKHASAPSYLRDRLRKTSYLIHSICELQIEVLHDVGYLSFEFQLVVLLEVQAGRIDQRQKNTVHAGLANLHASGIDSFRSISAILQEGLNRGALLRGSRRRDVGRVDEKSQQRCLISE